MCSNNIASSLLLERDYFVEPPTGCALIISGQCQSDVNIPSSSCPSSRWYQPPLPYNITLSDGTHYGGQVVYAEVDCTADAWEDGCTVEFCDRLVTGEAQAALIMSIPYIMSAIMSPILGFAIDRFGKRAIIASLAPLILIVVHLLLGFTSIDPIGPLVGQGLAYVGFAAVLWPAIPLVIEDRLTGLGFGIVTSALNLACAVIPLIIAAIATNSGGKYIPNVELVFVSLGIVGWAVGIYLNVYDSKHGGLLNSATASEDGYEAIDRDEVKSSPIIVGNVSDHESSMNSHLPLERRRSASNSTDVVSAARKLSFTSYETIHRGGGL